VPTDVLPAPDTEKLAAPQPAEERYRIKGGRFEFPYAVPFRQASRAHQWLADAYLKDFREHKREPAEARNRIASAARHCEWARQHDPHALQPYFTKAYLFLVEEAFNSAPPAAAQRVSQTILKVAKPYIDQMCTVPEVLVELRHPVPENRPNAMACLAMAAASFDLSVRADSSPEQQRAYVDKTHAWADRALGLDPGFSEPQWFLAAVNQRLALVAKDKGNKAAAAEYEKEAISRLSNIKPGSPRYERAQQILLRYGVND